MSVIRLHPVSMIYFDDISMTESSATKNVTITLRDNGVAATGKTIVIKDSSGAPISPQPTIEENEGVYTVKNLTFANLTRMVSSTRQRPPSSGISPPTVRSLRFKMNQVRRFLMRR